MSAGALGNSAAIVRELEVLADDSVAGGYSETVARKAIAHILALRALLSSVEDSEGLVRYLNEDAARLLAKSKQVPSTEGQMKYEQLSRKQANAAARITQDAQEKAALKERIWQIRVELGALFTMLPNEVPGLAMEVCERDADRQCLFRAFELAAHKEGA